MEEERFHHKYEDDIEGLRARSQSFSQNQMEAHLSLMSLFDGPWGMKMIREAFEFRERGRKFAKSP